MIIFFTGPAGPDVPGTLPAAVVYYYYYYCQACFSVHHVSW